MRQKENRREATGGETARVQTAVQPQYSTLPADCQLPFPPLPDCQLPFPSLPELDFAQIHQAVAPQGARLFQEAVRHGLEWLSASLQETVRSMLEWLSASLQEALRSVLERLAAYLEALPYPLSHIVAALVLATGKGDKEEALDVLLSSRAGGLFTRTGLFHPERWRALLREAGVDPDEAAFQHSVRSALILAAPCVPLDLSIECWLRQLHNEVRTTIEREWLDGDTLDKRLDRKGRAAAFPESPEALAAVAELAEEVEEQLDVRALLARLRPKDRLLAALVLAGHTVKEIARKMGISEKAVYARQERLWARLAGAVKKM